MKTNKKMMILSFIGIIIIVLGHTGDQIKLVSNIFPYYSFHMVLFVFISGYFYKTQNENNLWGKNGYILKKVKKMLIPYFIWNFMYGIIINCFKDWDIVPYGDSINLRSLFVKPWITGHQYILNVASWFLLALFLVNISYILIRKSSTKIKLWNDYIATFIFFVIAIICIYYSKKNLGEYYIPLLRTGFFLFFYQLGYLYKTKIEGKIKINTILYFIILIIVQLIILKIERKVIYYAVFMQFESKYILTPIIVSVTGILFWTKIAEILTPSLGNSKIVNYISNNTYDIMQHHLFCIFLVNVFFYKISGIFKLNGFDVQSFRQTIYYYYTTGINQFQILYTILAISMPLSIRYFYNLIKSKFDNDCIKKLLKK